ncbi:tetratricopeptide repeat protein [Prochlorococcus marinus]|uniref:tetratricopeptide repeat protein n=1 Tax=Prochlorococcus marinus TaxID=1219 RepID=UPI002FBF072E
MYNSIQEEGQNKITEVKVFSVPFALGEIKENIIISTNNSFETSKEEIINQAFNFHSQGNISEAAKYYQYCIKQGLIDHRVFSNYGVILKDLGKLKEAESLQCKAIELNPNFANAHHNLGNILKDLGKLQEAELSYRKAIEIKPNYADAHLNLGNILSDLGKLQEAELSIRKAIEIKPDFAAGHYNLGIILNDLGKLQEAELSLRKAICLNKSLDNVISSLGSVLMRQGKHKEGIQKLREGDGCVKMDYRSPSKTIKFFK